MIINFKKIFIMTKKCYDKSKVIDKYESKNLRIPCDICLSLDRSYLSSLKREQEKLNYKQMVKVFLVSVLICLICVLMIVAMYILLDSYLNKN